MKLIKQVTDIYGLILTGGQSSRMGTDKALISYRQNNQLAYTYALVNKYCKNTFVSASKTNAHEATRQVYPLIIDQFDQGGPLMGIASAMRMHPDKAWLIIACDLPLLDEVTLDYLLAHRGIENEATAFNSNHDGLPEPLCAIWEPRINARITTAFSQERYCPRKILIQADTELLTLPTAHALDNANTPDEKKRIQSLL